MWPRHYRAALCSDAATFGSGQPARQVFARNAAFTDLPLPSTFARYLIVGRNVGNLNRSSGSQTVEIRHPCRFTR